MAPQEHKTCYGTMFPDPFHPVNDRGLHGKVFSLKSIDFGGMQVPRYQVLTDLRQWDDCLGCPEFDHCYRLCTARLAIEEAVEAR